jgi:hypothetical protein
MVLRSVARNFVILVRGEARGRWFGGVALGPRLRARGCGQVMWESDCDWRDAAGVGWGRLRQRQHGGRDGLDAWDIRRSAAR